MGLLGITRHYTPGYAAVAQPLIELLNCDHRSFTWGGHHRAAFTELKARFTTSEALTAPDYGKPFEVWADASLHASGALLVQRNDLGLPRVVECHSHQFAPVEQRYTVAGRGGGG